jgi:hypothetical protein
MKRLSQFFALIMLVCTINAYGQEIQDVIVKETSVIPTFQPTGKLPLTQYDLKKGLSTTSLIGMLYHDRDIPPIFWNIPFPTTINLSGVPTAANIVSMSQLFTQPTSAGTLDSVWVYLFKVSVGGSLRCDILRDSTKLLGTRYFHIPDYTNYGLLDSSEVSFLDVDSLHYTTVKFNGNVLPKNFNFLVRPMVTSGIQSAFTIVTDSRLGLLPNFTTDAARTTSIFVIQSGAWGTIPLYGAYSWGPVGKDTARNPMMYAVAWVTPDEGAAVTPSSDASGLTLYQNYPNPVSSIHSRTYIRYDIAKAGTTLVEVYDAVGRKVATVANEYTTPGSYSKALDASNLAAGCYSYRITNSGKVLSRSFLRLK